MKECIDEKNYILSYNLQWFAKDGEGGEKTEPATQKKLDDARNEGKAAKSRELTAGFDLIVLFLCLKIFVEFVGERLIAMFSFSYKNMAEFTQISSAALSSEEFTGFLMKVLLNIMLIILPFLGFGLVVTFLINVVQVKWKVSTKPLEPKLSKLNPMNGFKRIFSKESLFNLLLSIAKIGLIGVVAYISVKDHVDELYVLYDVPLEQGLALVGDLILNTGLKISIVYLIIGFVDFFYQRWKFKDDMKMTKQEVKDEYKNTEGDPQIKSRQKRVMQETSRRRMMQDVPKADVVITNPTHYAVALKYDPQVSQAPILLAKGEDFMAQKIKEIARENGVEIVENKPLARAIYHNVDVGGQIPPELYQAVAEVLAMIYNKKH